MEYFDNKALNLKNKESRNATASSAVVAFLPLFRNELKYLAQRLMSAPPMHAMIATGIAHRQFNQFLLL